MKIFNELKEFIGKGNVIDLAVAVVISSSFGSIISSIVTDLITPPPLLKSLALNAAHVENLEMLFWDSVKYGNYIGAVTQFAIISLIQFITLRPINSIAKRKQSNLPSARPSNTDQLLKYLWKLVIH